MVWSPPRNRTSRSRLAGLVLLMLCSGASGCALKPAMLASMHAQLADRNAQLASRDQVPKFDEPPAPRIAATGPAPGVISAPKPFAWERVGQSAGKRPFQRLTVGQDGFRTLVVGSVGGNDPAAVGFVDELAKYLHNNSLILAGFESTVVRTLNPDGESNRKLTNQDGIYINHQFLKSSNSGDSAKQTPEVRFLLQQVESVRPQRIVHVRSVQGNRGMIAASKNAATIGREIAEWLQFEFVELPGKAKDGTLERYFAEQGENQILMFGIPESLKGVDIWDTCSDPALNLLLKENFSTRDLARKQKSPGAANRNLGDSANP